MATIYHLQFICYSYLLTAPYFDDCDHAEAYVHALLEVAGVRLADNREFFTLSASEAINAVIQAQAKLGSTTPSQNNDALNYGAGS